MTWTPNGAGSYIKFYGAADAEKNNLIDSAKSGTPTFASGDVTVPVNTGAVITNVFRNTTAATFYGEGLDSIGAVDVAGIQGGDYLRGDAVDVSLVLPSTITLANDYIISFDWIRLDHPTLTYQDFMGSSSGKLRQFNTGRLLVDDGTNRNFSTGPVADDQLHYIITRTSGVLSAEANGVSLGGDLSTTASLVIDNLMTSSGGAARMAASPIANIIINDVTAGVTYKWDFDNITDNGDGTGNSPQTGTSSQADATVQNFVAATDIVTVPNNTFSYDLSEGSGTTLGSTPSGKNITLVNNPTWN
jgi:hypothetical protein